LYQRLILRGRFVRRSLVSSWCLRIQCFFRASFVHACVLWYLCLCLRLLLWWPQFFSCGGAMRRRELVLWRYCATRSVHVRRLLRVDVHYDKRMLGYDWLVSYDRLQRGQRLRWRVSAARPMHLQRWLRINVKHHHCMRG
jgi:hypothetical protein